MTSRAPAWGEEACSFPQLLTEGFAGGGRAPNLRDLIRQSWSGQANLTPERNYGERISKNQLRS